jgi:hypothetical protein
MHLSSQIGELARAKKARPYPKIMNTKKGWQSGSSDKVPAKQA